VTTTSARFTGLTNGRSYTVRVRAHNAAPQPGPWSDWSAPAVPVSVPDAPGGLAVAPVAAGQLQVTWQAPASHGAPLGSYQLTVDGAGGSRSFAPAANVTSYAVAVENGVQYTFTLRASNAVGQSAPATVQGSTFGVPDAPWVVSVVGQAGGAYGQGEATVTVSPPQRDGGSPITSYQVRASNGQLVTMTGTETTVTGLSGGQNVTVQAQACNQRGCGAWSNTLASLPTPQTAPGSVDSLNLEVRSDAQGRPVSASASWSPPDWAGGADGRQYRVRWFVNGQLVSEATTTACGADLTEGLSQLGEDGAGTISVTVAAETSVGAGADAQKDWTHP
jgi:hypothetical protein